MVRIPDRPYAQLAGGRLDPAATGSGSALALREVSRQSRSLFDAVMMWQDQRDHSFLVEAQNAYGKAMTDWTTNSELNRQGGAAQGFAQDFTDTHAQTAEQIASQLEQRGGSGNAVQAFRNWSTQRETAGFAQAVQFEHRQMQLYGQDMHQLRVQEIIEQLGNNPASFPDAFQQLRESFALAVGQGVYRPEQATALYNDSRDKLKVNAFENLYAVNRGQAMKSLDALGFNASQKAKAQKRYQADVRADAARARAGVAVERARLRERETDLLAAFEVGAPVDTSLMPSEKEYVRAFGETEGKARFAALGEAEEFGLELKNLASMTPQEQAALVSSKAALSGEKESEGGAILPGAPGYAAARKRQKILADAISQDAKLRAADPAAYVLRADDSIRSAYEAISQGTATPEQFDAYALAVKGGYEARGMPATGPLLPKPLLQNIGSAYTQSAPEAAAGLVLQQKEQWGRHWPEVYKQLVTDKDVKLPTSAYAIGAGMEAEPAVLLAEASQTPDFEKTVKERKPEDVKTLDEKLPGHFEDLGLSLRRQGGLAQERLLYGEARKLALQYILHGLAPDDAAEKAAEEIGAKRYTFQNGYRVPKNYEGKPLDAGKVTAGAQAFLRENLAKADWVLPDRGAPWQKPEEIDQATRNAIRQNAEWVTDKEEEGLVLYRGPFAVQKKDGGVVRLSWRELEELSQKNKHSGSIDLETGVYQELW